MFKLSKYRFKWFLLELPPICALFWALTGQTDIKYGIGVLSLLIACLLNYAEGRSDVPRSMPRAVNINVAGDIYVDDPDGIVNMVKKK